MSRSLRRTVVVLAVALLGIATSSAAGSGGDISVTLDRTDQSARVGSAFTLSATVANSGPVNTPPLTVHLEIIDPTRAGSVDAEDWVRDLNIAVPVVEAGSEQRVSWDLVPIAPGRFTVYVVAVPESSSRRGGETVATGASAAVAVADARTLNAGGALPVAVITPLLVLGALGVARIRHRTRR